MDEEFIIGCTSFATLIFLFWLFWSGDTLWNDNNHFYLTSSEKCNVIGLCDIKNTQDLVASKLSINKAVGSIVFFDKSGRISQELKNCSIVDRSNFLCPSSGYEMVDDRFIKMNFSEVGGGSNIVELSPATWRLNWAISHFIPNAASKIEEFFDSLSR